MSSTINTTRDPIPSKWNASQIPSQKGKHVIVTGANSGIGFVTALELARHGANVVLACRNEVKGCAAIKAMEKELTLSPDAGKVEYRHLDVSSLASVETFAKEFRKTHDRLDILVNNAGVMAVPFARSIDGHFALTARLFDVIKQSEHARIVNVSNTKLYNLLFTAELNRRLEAKGITNVVAVGVHPGFVATNLTNPFFERSNWFQRQVLNLIWMLPICQTPEYGALPSLYAATAPGVKPNDYYVPDGLRAWTGYPTLGETMNIVKSEKHALALWEVSENLAKLKFLV